MIWLSCGLRRSGNELQTKKLTKMKTLKLNKLNTSKISTEQANKIRGGCSCCTCGCQWESNGGSSTMNNGIANSGKGLFTTHEVKMAISCP
jgi:natural product precursor